MSLFRKILLVISHLFPITSLMGSIILASIGFPYWWAFLLVAFIGFANLENKRFYSNMPNYKTQRNTFSRN